MNTSPHSKRNTIEFIKSILLVVLCLSTILLLYFFWTDKRFEDFSLDDLPFMDAEEESMEMLDVLLPTKMWICHGEGTYTGIEHKKPVWNGQGNSLFGYFVKFMSNSNMIFEEITKEQYASIMEKLCLCGEFEYGLPFEGLCALAGSEKPAGSDSSMSINQLVISMGSPESFFLADENSDKYYRLALQEQPQGLEQWLTQLDSTMTNPYFEVGTVVGSPIENKTLMPIALEAELREMTCTKEFADAGGEEIQELAKSFFGDSFDFVRKIDEANGTKVYMYGYGEKILIAGKDGTIEYKEDISATSEKAGFFISLERALKFISAHEGIEALKGHVTDIFLKSVTKGARNGSYHFYFGTMIDGLEVSYMESSPLELEVCGQQVTYYRRALFEDFQEASRSRTSEKEVSEAVNVLAKNYDKIYIHLTQNPDIEEPVAAQTAFIRVANSIDKISYGYLILNQKQQNSKKTGKTAVEPVWMISLENGRVNAYFGLYSADYLGCSVTER
ncbi:MAG: hypothetical protein K6F52_05325 [Clostridia bacterium]|nr:hypothetical protein [Clostridia bacterium]